MSKKSKKDDIWEIMVVILLCMLSFLMGASIVTSAKAASMASSDADMQELLEQYQKDYLDTHQFLHAVMTCQEYEYKLIGCDSIKKQQDKDSAEQERLHKIREEQEKKAAQKIVSDALKQLNKGEDCDKQPDDSKICYRYNVLGGK